jgi:hypothetical protein
VRDSNKYCIIKNSDSSGLSCVLYRQLTNGERICLDNDYCDTTGTTFIYRTQEILELVTGSPIEYDVCVTSCPLGKFSSEPVKHENYYLHELLGVEKEYVCTNSCPPLTADLARHSSYSHFRYFERISSFPTNEGLECLDDCEFIYTRKTN